MQPGEPYSQWIDGQRHECLSIDMVKACNFGTSSTAENRTHDLPEDQKRGKDVPSGPKSEARSFACIASASDVVSTQDWSQTASSQESTDLEAAQSDTTEMDILIQAGSRKAALIMIDRLSASAIDFALKVSPEGQ